MLINEQRVGEDTFARAMWIVLWNAGSIELPHL